MCYNQQSHSYGLPVRADTQQGSITLAYGFTLHASSGSFLSILLIMSGLNGLPIYPIVACVGL